jgi:hypothetical protein
MPFIYSTLTCTNTFAVFAAKSDPHSLSRVIKRIAILGGHGMKNPQGIDTPKGVVTKVTDGDLELLQSMVAFRSQVEAGYLVVDKNNVDPATKAESMNSKDGSSPLTPKDFEKSEDLGEDVPTYKKQKPARVG